MIEIILGDCLPTLQSIASESIDLVVTDPPYHIVSGGCSNDGRYSMGGVLSRQNKRVGEGKIFDYNNISFSEWVPQVYRVLKPSTHCYLMINARNLKELQQAAEDSGFVFQNLIVWDKGNVTPNKWYLNAHELILMLRKGAAKNINNMGEKNILRVPNITHKKLHPTEKPVDLMKIFVQNSTQVGDVVLDPFMGAGSVGVACQQIGRKFIGCEIDEQYYNIAAERLSAIDSQTETLENEQLEMAF